MESPLEQARQRFRTLIRTSLGSMEREYWTVEVLARILDHLESQQPETRPSSSLTTASPTTEAPSDAEAEFTLAPTAASWLLLLLAMASGRAGLDLGSLTLRMELQSKSSGKTLAQVVAEATSIYQRPASSFSDAAPSPAGLTDSASSELGPNVPWPERVAEARAKRGQG